MVCEDDVMVSGGGEWCVKMMEWCGGGEWCVGVGSGVWGWGWCVKMMEWCVGVGVHGV